MTMDKHNRLQEVLAAYGTDPAHWPDADRLELVDVMAASTDQISEADEIDRVLAAAGKPSVPTGGQARLAELARQTPQEEPVENYQTFGVSRFAAMTTLAASLFVGIYMGTLGTLDPFGSGDTGFGIASEIDDFEDPFELESLIGNNPESAG